MSKYEVTPKFRYDENPILKSDEKGVLKNIVNLAVAGANGNLKLSEFKCFRFP